MVFSSLIFLFGFLPIVLAVYFVAPRAWRNGILLAASLCFYAWGETGYVILMVFSAVMNHLFGLWVDAARGRPSARWAIAIAVAANLSLLGWFKYANFAVENVNRLLGGGAEGPLHLDTVHLPIGISFFTFQALTYVIDVHRGVGRVERNPFRVALYISLFPQLIAGPIVRFHDIARELVSRRPQLVDVAYGMRRFALGLGKKVLIANLMASTADGIFAMPTEHLTPSLAWLGATSYALQIYFDFSGYSDIAIGLGRLLASTFWRTSGLRTSLALSPTSGDAGTSRCQRGSGITCTSRWEGVAEGRPHHAAPVHRLCALRAVAWGELDLRRLGSLSRCLSWRREGAAWPTVSGRLELLRASLHTGDGARRLGDLSLGISRPDLGFPQVPGGHCFWRRPPLQRCELSKPDVRPRIRSRRRGFHTCSARRLGMVGASRGYALRSEHALELGWWPDRRRHPLGHAPRIGAPALECGAQPIHLLPVLKVEISRRQNPPCHRPAVRSVLCIRDWSASPGLPAGLATRCRSRHAPQVGHLIATQATAAGLLSGSLREVLRPSSGLP